MVECWVQEDEIETRILERETWSDKWVKHGIRLFEENLATKEYNPGRCWLNTSIVFAMNFNTFNSLSMSCISKC